ncbi:hypothetical protein F5Y17DRAFT_453541, partial [Xylariaceae sp. FL0594]
QWLLTSLLRWLVLLISCSLRKALASTARTSYSNILQRQRSISVGTTPNTQTFHPISAMRLLSLDDAGTLSLTDYTTGATPP